MLTSPATRPTPSPHTRWLHRPEGRLAYDITGEGPLVVCVPGMGDLRSAYRTLVPALVGAGHRVATLDLRGHGESDTTFSRHDDVAAGTDVLALLEELGGGPAVLVGSSMGAGAVTWAAAEAPDRVAGLVLLGPFVRDTEVGALARLALRVGLARPWGPRAWSAYYARLYPSSPPADLAEHRAAIRAALTRPGAWRSFQATTRTSHQPVAERITEVRAPAVVVMGGADPDFPDPAAEAAWVADALGGEALVVPEVGHYPHNEAPEVVVPAVVGFLRGLDHPGWR